MPLRHVNRTGKVLEAAPWVDTLTLGDDQEVHLACPTAKGKLGRLTLVHFVLTAKPEVRDVPTPRLGSGEKRPARVMDVAYYAGPLVTIGEMPILGIRVGNMLPLADRETRAGIAAEHPRVGRALAHPVARDTLFVCVGQE